MQYKRSGCTGIYCYSCEVRFLGCGIRAVAERRSSGNICSYQLSSRLVPASILYPVTLGENRW
jgi:hypothetical protein